MTTEEQNRQTQNALLTLRYIQQSINHQNEENGYDMDGLYFAIGTALDHLCLVLEVEE